MGYSMRWVGTAGGSGFARHGGGGTTPRDAGPGWGMGMGRVDRDYYRDEEGGPIANWFRHGLVTKILFAITAIAFIVQISTQSRHGASVSGQFSELLSLNAEKVLRGYEAWRLVTYVFLNPTDK